MRRLPRFSKLTWAALISFATLVAFLWLAGHPCDVKVVYAGCTNAPGTKYGVYGVFVVTNAGAGNITLWPEFSLEGDGPELRRWGGTFHETTWIIPGGSGRQVVPAPKSVDRWRLTLLCSPDCFRASLGEYFGTGREGWSRTILRDWLHIVPVKRISTEWVCNEMPIPQSGADGRQSSNSETNPTPSEAASRR